MGPKILRAALLCVCLACAGPSAHSADAGRRVSVLDETLIDRIDMDSSLIEVLEFVRLKGKDASGMVLGGFSGPVSFQYSFSPKKSFKQIKLDVTRVSLRQAIETAIRDSGVKMVIHSDRVEFLDE